VTSPTDSSTPSPTEPPTTSPIPLQPTLRRRSGRRHRQPTHRCRP
jgi:hypothetical protein